MNIDQNFLIIATGTNLGDRKKNLMAARDILSTHLKFIAESRIYESPAVDYLNQPDFYNQVLQFELPQISPTELMALLLDIEKQMGRNRLVPKGPRLIDLDVLFWGAESFKEKNIEVPHPRAFERSFVVLPLSELPAFLVLKNYFHFNFNFSNHAAPLS